MKQYINRSNKFCYRIALMSVVFGLFSASVCRADIITDPPVPVDPYSNLVNQMTQSINMMKTDLVGQINNLSELTVKSNDTLVHSIGELVKAIDVLRQSNETRLDGLNTKIGEAQNYWIEKIFADFQGLEKTKEDVLIANDSATTNLTAVNQLQSKQIAFELYKEGQNTTAPRAIVGDHFRDYCDRTSTVENNIFPDGCKAPLDLAHADLKLSSLLVPVRFTDDQQTAAKVFMRNIIKPFPASIKVSNLEETMARDEEGTEKIANALINEAALSAARHSLATSYLYRLPGGDENTKTPSVMEIMEKEASRRFADADWSTNVKKASHAVLLREIAQMQAFQIWLEYQRYRQMERVEGLLASQMAGSQMMMQEIRKGNEQADQAKDRADQRAKEREKARQNR